VMLDLRTGRFAASTVPARAALTTRGPAMRPGVPRSIPAAAPTDASPGAVPTPSAAPAPAPATPAPAGRATVIGAVELLPLGDPFDAPARLRRHLTIDGRPETREVSLAGDLAPWVSSWRGSGQLTARWALRDCTPTGTLPPPYGQPTLATAAIDPTSGVVRRLLISEGRSADPPQLLGAYGSAILVRAPRDDGGVNVLAWHVDTGRFSLVTTVDDDGAVAVADRSGTA
ncbi:MAG TPA: hypothetical protein VES42_09870, partial [Pilimelia sp.]|nr:hypothetical protein [Pilimelia sp.]